MLAKSIGFKNEVKSHYQKEFLSNQNPNLKYKPDLLVPWTYLACVISSFVRRD